MNLSAAAPREPLNSTGSGRHRKVHIVKLVKSMVSVMLTLTLLAGMVQGTGATEVNAAGAQDKVLTIAAARTLALANSSEFESAEDDLEAKYMALESARKAMELTYKRLNTFSWTPLLSFKFPESPKQQDLYELEFSITEKQADIDVSKRKLANVKYKVYDEVNVLYCSIYTTQVQLDFNKKKLESVDEALAKNKARLATGEASQADIDSLQSKHDTLEKTIAAEERSLASSLRKMSQKTGIDVTTGYIFEEPFLAADINREYLYNSPDSRLDSVIQWTKDKDEDFYDVCMAETTAKLSLQTNFDIMKRKYGSDINLISGYVTQALNGQTINKKAFKTSYKDFLKKVDSYWEGKKRILFIKIPRIWFKGSTAGTRFVEDDPYVLQEDALEYQSARSDRILAETELENSVVDAFDGYVSARSAYETAVENVNTNKDLLDKARVQNAVGDMSFEEYQQVLESYEESQNTMIESLQSYSDTLNNFDDLTKGWVSGYLDYQSLSLGTGANGISYKEDSDRAYYTLESIIQNQEFELRITIPEDFDTEITDYELWLDGVQVGTRTAIDSKLRHVAVAKTCINKAFIRFYNGDEFVDDCEISPSKTSDYLNIVVDRGTETTESDVLATYITDGPDTVGMTTITVTPSADVKASFYRIRTSEGQFIGSEDYIEAGGSLRYLNLITGDMSALTVEFYDDGKALIETGYFATSGSVIMREPQ